MPNRKTQVTLPELALIAGTRVFLGTGLGLLLANRLTEEQRKAAGWALLSVGALSTIPLAFEVLGGRHLLAPSPEQRETDFAPQAGALTSETATG